MYVLYHHHYNQDTEPFPRHKNTLKSSLCSQPPTPNPWQPFLRALFQNIIQYETF